MLKAKQQPQAILLDLTESIAVYTTISKEYHAPLRSGFNGYTPNPRWCAQKYCAWKTGRQWRASLAAGTMVVRSADNVLVSKEKEMPLPLACSLTSLPENRRFMHWLRWFRPFRQAHQG